MFANVGAVQMQAANRPGGVSYISRTTYTGSNSNPSVSPPTGYQSGDLFVAMATTRNSYLATPSGWTQRLFKAIDGANVVWPGNTTNESVYIWTKTAGASESTITWTLTDQGTDSQTLQCLCFRGASGYGAQTIDNTTAGTILGQTASAGDMFVCVNGTCYQTGWTQNTTISGSMTTLGHLYESGGATGLASWYESVGAGATGSRTLTNGLVSYMSQFSFLVSA